MEENLRGRIGLNAQSAGRTNGVSGILLEFCKIL